jgi:glycosyltransferase involved in cell wall biosynthesis
MAAPEKVLITGGHEVGGVASFADGLAQGFTALGIPSEVICPSRILSKWRSLRDPKILKILSTAAVYAAPFAKRAICMAHGIPRAHQRGGFRMLGVLGTWKLANACRGTQLVSVSMYTATHLEALFNLRSDGVILNPVKPAFLEAPEKSEEERSYITFVGRLDPCKNLHRLLPSICNLLDENPGLRVCIIGEGPQKKELEDAVKGDSRVEFKGYVDDLSLRTWLRRSKIFVSGNETEGLGIAYLEALSQGCVVVMPASGGGLEVALDHIGKSVHLLPLSFDRPGVLSVLRRALASDCALVAMTAYSAEEVAKAYLRVDSRFSLTGEFMGYSTELFNHEAA